MYINLTRLPDLALFRYVCLGSFILAFEVDTKKVEVYWGSKYSSEGQQSFFTAQNFVNFQISKSPHSQKALIGDAVVGTFTVSATRRRKMFESG